MPKTESHLQTLQHICYIHLQPETNKHFHYYLKVYSFQINIIKIGTYKLSGLIIYTDNNEPDNITHNNTKQQLLITTV